MNVNAQGNALPVSLIMLLVLTVLGIAGLRVAQSELEMAGAEQFHAMAFMAAESAVEEAIANSDKVPSGAIETRDPVLSGVGISGTASVDYLTSSNVPGGGASMANQQFAAYHFSITAQGTAPANSSATITQGIYVEARGGN